MATRLQRNLILAVFMGGLTLSAYAKEEYCVSGEGEGKTKGNHPKGTTTIAWECDRNWKPRDAAGRKMLKGTYHDSNNVYDFKATRVIRCRLKDPELSEGKGSAGYAQKIAQNCLKKGSSWVTSDAGW